MSEPTPTLSIDFEVGPGFPASGLAEEAERMDIDFGVSSGFNADRILKMITDLKVETLEALRSLAMRILGIGEVKGLKISLDGVEIGSTRTSDLDELRTTITETLDALRPGADPR